MPERPGTPPMQAAPAGWLNLPAMRYPDEYVWFLLFSSMDVMLTWVILSIGGWEANPIARLVIDTWGLPGAIGFKFSLMLAVIVICEVIGRSRPRIAKHLVQIAIIVSAMPVAYSFVLLSYHVVHI